MKKVLVLLLVLVLALSMFTACGKDKATDKLVIWSFTNEMKTVATAFMKANPDIEVEYVMIPMTDGEFQTKVKAAIQSGDVPDVMALEAAFVREYVESDWLADLTHLVPMAEELETYQFVLDVGTYEGVTKAYSYQATPGAVFYRRSLAKEYFGTDDPADIQAMMSDMDGFAQMAATIQEKSAGATYIVPSNGDFTNPFFMNRDKPWVVDGALHIDPKVEDLFDTAKMFRDMGYEAQATQWQEGWFAGMNDSLADADGNAKQVFCYFLPTWGLPYVLMPNGGDTAGDWAAVTGPLPYSWGGTWAGVLADSQNKVNAEEFVKFFALNEDTLTNWALGTYSNDWLKEVDPDIGDEQAQGPGDFVSSQVVVNKIVSEFDDAETSAFLAGQNSYSGFAAAAPTIDLGLMQGTDDAIQRALNDVLNGYVQGDYATYDEAIAVFKDAVRSAVPDITVE